MSDLSFIFSWDMLGIESIIPIDQYYELEKQNLLKILKNEPITRNPLNSIMQSLIMRARFNPQRFYEIYSIKCSAELDTEFWQEQWERDPQGTAELVRCRGHKIYSDRKIDKSKIRIT